MAFQMLKSRRSKTCCGRSNALVGQVRRLALQQEYVANIGVLHAFGGVFLSFSLPKQAKIR
jgi:hypothetical protein